MKTKVKQYKKPLLIHKTPLNPFKDHQSHWGWIMENLRNIYGLVVQFNEEHPQMAAHLTTIHVARAVEDWKKVRKTDY